MATRSNNAPLIVIAGPTASGKSALAIELAQQFDGEIICADSRTIYKHMDIGTAKPSAEEQVLVPHWGLDLVEPGQPFSAADFKQYALQKIDEIRARGHVTFLVGGTGLYIDAIIFDYQFGEPADAQRRQELEKMSIQELNDYCIKNNVKLPENTQNKRYLIRAIEQNGINTTRTSTTIDNCIVVGIATENETLKSRIKARSEHLFETGMVEEAIMLGEKYGWESEAMTGNIYPLVKQFLDGELNEDELKDKFVTADWRLAKRQMTWLKRNKCIHWLSLNDARTFIVNSLSSK